MEGQKEGQTLLHKTLPVTTRGPKRRLNNGKKNFKPVSALLCVSKIFEGIIQKHLSEYFEKNYHHSCVIL